MIASSAPYMRVSLRRPPTTAREEKQQRCANPLPSKQLSGRDRERSCSKKCQQICCFWSTVNLSGTEVPKNTLKSFQLSVSQEKPTHQGSAALLCHGRPRSSLRTRPRGLQGRAAAGDHVCGLSASLWLGTGTGQLCVRLAPTLSADLRSLLSRIPHSRPQSPKTVRLFGQRGWTQKAVGIEWILTSNLMHICKGKRLVQGKRSPLYTAIRECRRNVFFQLMHCLQRFAFYRSLRPISHIPH